MAAYTVIANDKTYEIEIKKKKESVAGVVETSRSSTVALTIQSSPVLAIVKNDGNSIIAAPMTRRIIEIMVSVGEKIADMHYLNLYELEWSGYNKNS